jgi:hypothetical protein
MRCSLARRSDANRKAATLTDFAEAVLVRRVIADENRPTAAERRLGHKGSDRQPFIHIAGLKFDDHLPRDEAYCCTRLTLERLGVGAKFLFAIRHRAVVQRQSGPLVFEDQPAGVLRQRGELWAYLIECRAAGAVENAIERPVGTAALNPVQPRGGAAPGLEKVVEFGKRTTADQRERSVALFRKGRKQRGQAAGNPDEFRTGGNLEEGAVDIEEQGGLQIERRRAWPQFARRQKSVFVHCTFAGGGVCSKHLICPGISNHAKAF